jgi:hypothetical protein
MYSFLASSDFVVIGIFPSSAGFEHPNNDPATTAETTSPDIHSHFFMLHLHINVMVDEETCRDRANMPR